MRAVLATDLSDAIDAAIDSTICLECLGRYGITQIDLVTVTSPNVTTGMPGSNVGAQTKRVLERQRATLEREGFGVDTHVVRGAPHRRINGLADRVDADLVVAGSRGKSPLQERFIGGTARDLTRTTVRPLLLQRIVRDDDEYAVANEHLFQRVLYATDFSANAERAFDQFRFLNHAAQAVTLLHVTPPERRAGDGGVDGPRERLDALADDLHAKGIDDVETVVRAGEATSEILATEADVDPTVVLLGARGQSRIRRLLAGSTSQSVAARADSNVLLVPPSQAR